MTEPYRSGFVAIVGRPNTGKSTLVNTFLKRKVAIVSDKPQTTRHAIRAIVNLDQLQMIFIDTPGYHKPHHLMGEMLNRSVEHIFNEVDAVLFMVDGAGGVGRGDEFVADRLSGLKTPVIVCVNKIDLLSAEHLAEEMELASNLGDFYRTLPVSAQEGSNVDTLLEELAALMPPGPQYYPDEMSSDQPEQVIAAEIIREKILNLTREEVPHSIAVEIEHLGMRNGKDLLDIEAFVYVEKKSQKGIVIGHEGSMLKQVGTAARRELETLFGHPIYLSLRVKLRKDWRKDAAFLARLGIR